MEFHDKLQQLRKQKGITQEELAAVLYVSRTAVSKWESGRGYPNIESLKALSKFYSVSIDDLLSGDELLTLAQEDSRQTQKQSCDLVFGLLDVSTVMFLFLPFFSQKTDGVIQAVSLLSLSGVSFWLRGCYFACVIGMSLWGIATLALQNREHSLWAQWKNRISLMLGGFSALVFIVSPHPYAAAFLFLLLTIKVLILHKTP